MDNYNEWFYIQQWNKIRLKKKEKEKNEPRNKDSKKNDKST